MMVDLMVLDLSLKWSRDEGFQIIGESWWLKDTLDS